MSGFFYTDIHTHILFGVDDGACDIAEAEKMLALAYENGTRRICLTPHSPLDKGKESAAAYAELRKICAERYPSLELMLGSEISFSLDSPEDIRAGRCVSLGGGNYYLVDMFLYDELGEEVIVKALLSFVSKGYRPILAHPERYSSLYKRGEKIIAELRSEGVLIQINSSSVFSSNAKTRKMARSLLKNGLADIVASDAHGAEVRTTDLSACEEYITKKYGAEKAYKLLKENPDKVLGIK